MLNTLIRRGSSAFSRSHALCRLTPTIVACSSIPRWNLPVSPLSTNASGSSTNSALPRTAISLLGATNAGKSVLMNLLTQSEVSLVHDTAGTTADPKICAMELHGRIGPVRLLDTPGINEKGELGSFKKERALHTIGQCDVAIIVADPFAPDQSAECVAQLLKEVERRQEMNQHADENAEEKEKIIGAEDPSLVSRAAAKTPIPVLVYNLRDDKVKELEGKGGSVSMLLDELEQKILTKMAAIAAEQVQADGSQAEPAAPAPALPPTLAVDFTSTKASRDRVISFLERHVDPRGASVQVLPDWLVDTHAEGYSPTVLLNIPMDAQTPGMRLLRPQAMVQEALIRNFVSTYAYRMDLGMARSDNPANVQMEKDRFSRVMDPLLSSGDLSLMITDSQAIDVVAPWTLDSSGNEIIPLTTFSITMIRYLSGGRLAYFTEGLRKLDEMISGETTPVHPESGKWRVLITEACNHTRLNMEKQCADIGTVQLPNHLSETLGADNVEFEYVFGKHTIIDPTRFDLVVHCGACMLNPQQMDARVADFMAAGVPATNYGLLLSRIQSPRTLSRVLKPWGINYDYENGHSDDDLVGT